jgi:hypothetical protein
MVGPGMWSSMCSLSRTGEYLWFFLSEQLLTISMACNVLCFNIVPTRSRAGPATYHIVLSVNRLQATATIHTGKHLIRPPRHWPRCRAEQEPGSWRALLLILCFNFCMNIVNDRLPSLVVPQWTQVNWREVRSDGNAIAGITRTSENTAAVKCMLGPKYLLLNRWI